MAWILAIPPDAWTYLAIRLSTDCGGDWATSDVAQSINPRALSNVPRIIVPPRLQRGANGGTQKIPAGRAVATGSIASSPMEFPNLTVLSHPLIQHKLTILRDKRTSTRDFKQLVNEIAMLMAYEVTMDLPLEPVDIETPLERMTGRQVAGKKLTLVPILRAGLGMVEGISQLI